MGSRTALLPFVIVGSAIAAAGARPIERTRLPGRQHLLTIEGTNTVTFVPQARVDPYRIEYRARVEYLVNTRGSGEANLVTEGDGKAATERTTTGAPDAIKRKKGSRAGSKVTGSVDIALHSTEMRFKQNDQVVLESRISRARFQGRFQPDAPVLTVSYKQAPPALELLLKKFDTPAASVLLDDRARVVRRVVRLDGPLHAIVETLLSIHTPIPRDMAFWEAPTQLAMGHGQTAKGILRFQKDKESVAQTGGLVKVRVSGKLRAEGAVVGNLIKNGIYTVTGGQEYDPHTREWKSARWSVDINNELANAAGFTVAQAQGQMVVESKALDARPATEFSTMKPTRRRPG